MKFDPKNPKDATQEIEPGDLFTHSDRGSWGEIKTILANGTVEVAFYLGAILPSNEGGRVARVLGITRTPDFQQTETLNLDSIEVHRAPIGANFGLQTPKGFRQLVVILHLSNGFLKVEVDGLGEVLTHASTLLDVDSRTAANPFGWPVLTPPAIESRLGPAQKIPFTAIRSELLRINRRCGFPGCQVTDPLQVAAISSMRPGGPRYQHERPQRPRMSVDNFLPLCPTHHVMVDRDPEKYSIDLMRQSRQEWSRALSEKPDKAATSPQDESPSAASDVLHSTFISYGGPDTDFAQRLNDTLLKYGGTTFFFAKDAIPGRKLHRLMREGVNQHERVILVCSKASLDRSGVLNEIAEALQREARDGGKEYLIPITLDDYVFSGWTPEDAGLAQAIRDRVVADFRLADADPTEYNNAVLRLIAALKK